MNFEAIHGIRVVRYRSIADQTLKIGNVTVILGESDTGKSNLIRAIRDWAFCSARDSVFQSGTRMTVVKVQIGPDIVTMVRDAQAILGSSTIYGLDGPSEQLTFTKVGRKVPDKIQEITGLMDVELDDIKIRAQFASQEEGWFMIGPPWTSSKVARVLGKLSGVDAIMTAIRHTNTEKIRTSGYLKAATREVEEVQLQVDALPDLSGPKRLLSQFGSAFVSASNKKRILEECEETYATWRTKKKRARTLALWVTKVRKTLGEIGDKISDLLNKFSEAEKKLSKLDRMKKKIQREENEAEVLEAKRDRLIKRIEEAFEDGTVLCPLCDSPAHKGCAEAAIKRLED